MTDEGQRNREKDVTIIRGDVLDALAKIPRKSVDLMVVDPPYTMNGEGAEHELTATVAIALRECTAKLKRDAYMVVACASSWRSIGYMIESVRGTGFAPKRFGTWHKSVSQTRVSTPGWVWASITVIVMQRGRPKTPKTPKTARVLDHIEAEPIRRKRRAQLPVSVADWMVAPWAIPGDVFLDPFAGSGALPLAAARAGLRAYGIEKTPVEGDDLNIVDLKNFAWKSS